LLIMEPKQDKVFFIYICISCQAEFWIGRLA